MSNHNSLKPSDTYICISITMSLVQIMACCLFSNKPLSEPMLNHCQLDSVDYVSMKFYLKFKSFLHENAFEIGICKMAALFRQPPCDNAISYNEVGIMTTLDFPYQHWTLSVPQGNTSLWCIYIMHGPRRTWLRSRHGRAGGNLEPNQYWSIPGPRLRGGKPAFR